MSKSKGSIQGNNGSSPKNSVPPPKNSWGGNGVNQWIKWKSRLFLGAKVVFPVLGLGAFISGYATDFAHHWWAPSVAVCNISEIVNPPTRADESIFTVLVSQPKGVQSEDISSDIYHSFYGIKGLSSVRTCKVLELGDGPIADEMVSTHEVGRRWLDDSGADVLIWGIADKSERKVSLWFLPRSGEERKLVIRDYWKSDEHPELFREAVLSIKVLTLSLIRPLANEYREFVIDALLQEVKQLRTIHRNPPQEATQDTMRELSMAYGVGLVALTYQTQNLDFAREAIPIIRSVAERAAESGDPNREMNALYEIGKVLTLLGRIESNPEIVQQAIEIFSRVQVHFEKHSDSVMNSGLLLLNLGNAHLILGELNKDVVSFSKAISTYENSREFIEDTPKDTSHRLSVNVALARIHIGIHNSDVDELRGAEQILREVAAEWPLSRGGIIWTKIQNSLAWALKEIGERECNTEASREAVRLLQELDRYYRTLPENESLLKISKEDIAQTLTSFEEVRLGNCRQ